MLEWIKVFAECTGVVAAIGEDTTGSSRLMAGIPTIETGIMEQRMMLYDPLHT